jgi:hypothetical protein
MPLGFSAFWPEWTSFRGGLCCPTPFRRLARRSGRIPALPYPPAKCVQRISSRMYPFCRYYGPQFIAKDFTEFIRISGYDARENLAVLPTIERENRTLAQIAERRVYPAWNAVTLEDARRAIVPLTQGQVRVTPRDTSLLLPLGLLPRRLPLRLRPKGPVGGSHRATLDPPGPGARNSRTSPYRSVQAPPSPGICSRSRLSRRPVRQS